MTDDLEPGPGATGETPGRMMRFATGVAGNLQAYKDSRPIATVDVGKGRVMQFGDTKFALYPDRVKTPKGTHTLTPAVHASVESAGGYKKKIDKRELYLTIEGEGWSITQQCDPRKGEKIRSFAHAVNSAVQALHAAPVSDPSAPSVSRAPPPTLDAADAIQKLADLRDAGVLSEQEFEAKKRALLAQI
jgi:hypothetical protein